MVPLADLLTCGDDPKSFTQLAKNEVYSSGMICSLMIILHNQFCHPVSARQNDWASGVVERELCEPQTHRMTPSSSMHGLSLINWLFCGIGLPKLEAAYSSRNASRVLSSLSPLQNSLFLRATIPRLPFCRLYCAGSGYVSVQLLSEGTGLRMHSPLLSSLRFSFLAFR